MQRFRLILEFCDHSRFPPPLCAITYPYILYKNLTKLRKCLPTLSTNCPKIKGHAQSTTDVEVGRNAEGSKTSQSSTKTSGKKYTTFTYTLNRKLGLTMTFLAKIIVSRKKQMTSIKANFWLS